MMMRIMIILMILILRRIILLKARVFWSPFVSREWVRGNMGKWGNGEG